MEYFVSGIDTGVGKTIASAVLCEVLKADYWKPVQAGDLQHSDSMMVRSLVSSDVRIWPEAHKLNTPASPHYSAKKDGVRIEPGAMQIPKSEKPLIIEGAGGLLVPLNDDQTYADLLQVWDIPVILVSRNYLGSINHTLMSIEILQQRGIPLAGILFNGEANQSTQEVIEKYSGITVLGHIPKIDRLDAVSIQQIARSMRNEVMEKLEERHPWNVAIEQNVRVPLYS